MHKPSKKTTCTNYQYIVKYYILNSYIKYDYLSYGYHAITYAIYCDKHKVVVNPSSITFIYCVSIIYQRLNYTRGSLSDLIVLN